MPQKHHNQLYGDDYEDGFDDYSGGSSEEEPPGAKPRRNPAPRTTPRHPLPSAKNVQPKRVPRMVEVTTEQELSEDVRQVKFNDRDAGIAEASTSQQTESGVGGPPRRSLAGYVPEAWMLGDVSEEKRTLHLIVVGHVDAGKSSLIGRVLWSLGRVSAKEMHKNKRESKQMGKGSFAYAWVMDEGSEERARGVTMTVGLAHFDTAKLHVVLLDAPGHRDFIPSMISGAATADAAILVVDASFGAFEAGMEGDGLSTGQTREHAQLVRSLGIEQLIVAVNKLDVVNYSKARFDHVQQVLQPFLRRCGFKTAAVHWIPVSASEDQNLTSSPSQASLASWYSGSNLLHAVDELEPPPRQIAQPLRLVIAETLKSRTLGQTAFNGKLDSGAIKPSLKVLVMPAGECATVKQLEQDGQALPIARAGDSVDVGLLGVEASCLVKGGVLCHPEYPVQVATSLEVKVLTLGILRPILQGSQVILHVHHASEAARVAAIVSLLDSKTGAVVRQRPRCLTANQSAILKVISERAVCVEEYSVSKTLGRVILRDEGKTIAVGIVTKIISDI